MPLQPFKTGETVRVKQEGEWTPAKVIEIADTPRSYLVKSLEIAVYRRNRRYLHKDESQNQSMPYTDVERNAKTKQPTSTEQEQHPQCSEDQKYPQSSGDQHHPQCSTNQQQETNNISDGYHTRSGRLVRVPERY